MIDPVDDDSDEREPDRDWFACPMMPRAEMLAMIERHKDLDGRGINLFKNALGREPRSDLLRHYVAPNLYHPGSHYIYTTPDPSRYRFKNWRPELTAAAIEHRSILACGLFSNTLSWINAADL